MGAQSCQKIANVSRLTPQLYKNRIQFSRNVANLNRARNDGSGQEQGDQVNKTPTSGTWRWFLIYDGDEHAPPSPPPPLFPLKRSGEQYWIPDDLCEY